MPHGDIPDRRFEVGSGIAAVLLLAAVRGPLDPSVTGAFAASSPDLRAPLSSPAAGRAQALPESSPPWLAPERRSSGAAPAPPRGFPHRPPASPPLAGRCRSRRGRGGPHRRRHGDDNRPRPRHVVESEVPLAVRPQRSRCFQAAWMLLSLSGSFAQTESVNRSYRGRDLNLPPGYALCGSGLSTNLRRMRTALWPPKPKLLLRATRTGSWRASFGTQSTSQSGSGVS
jgi:hypothetical protein